MIGRRANRSRTDSGWRSRAVEVAMRASNEHAISDRDEPSQTFCCLASVLLLMTVIVPAIFWKAGRSADNQDGPEAAEVSRTSVPSPSIQHYLPWIDNPVSFPASSRQLAFLKGGAIYLKEISLDPAQCGTWMECTLSTGDIKKLTTISDVIRFAWSPDGRRLAAFNGRSVQVLSLEPGGENRITIELDMPARQAANVPALMWTPDQSHLLLLNINNPQDDVPVGWFLIDPADRSGARLYPGRIGNVLALADGSLILTQVEQENQSLKTVGLWRFNPLSLDMEEFSLDIFNQNGGVGILNTEVMQHLLTGAAHVECGYYSGAPDSLNLGLISRLRSTKAKEMPHDFLLSPDGGMILATRGAACGGSIPSGWMDTCWPGGRPEDYAMHLWYAELEKENGEKLVSGMFADWSPDGKQIAFQSCLAVTPSGQSVSVDAEPPWVYVMQWTEDSPIILPISEGCFPAWRPVVR